MLYQTDFSGDKFSNAINKLGCAYMSLYYLGAKDGAGSTNERMSSRDNIIRCFISAIETGVISGDLNNNDIIGDIDDEGMIQDWDALCMMIAPRLRFAGRRDYGVPPNCDCAITQWYNAETGFKHFVVGNKRPVEYDPIRGGSITVARGRPISYRDFVYV